MSLFPRKFPRKRVAGVGIKDTWEETSKSEVVISEDGLKRVKRTIWTCPYYTTWLHLLKRCYNEKALKRRPSYAECYVCDDWLMFSNFKSWMQTQDWEDKQLDKDLLFRGNKVYGPDTCVFVTLEVNNFILEGNEQKKRAQVLPMGVTKIKGSGKFLAQINIKGVKTRIGLFVNPIEAHEAWLKVKLELAIDLASRQTDKRVSNALLNRYTNYTLPDYIKEEFGLK